MHRPFHRLSANMVEATGVGRIGLVVFYLGCIPSGTQ